MHGVIFTSLRDFVAAEHGQTTATDLFADEPLYLLSEAYPDERFHALLARLAETTGLDEAATLHAFGAFTAERTFARLYPAFFAIAPTAREFLLTVENRIHELVRATIPHAEPPRLSVVADGDEGGVRVEYHSPRRLCRLLLGLVEGTAAHYGERARSDEPACMHRGDEACVFLVRLSRL